MPTERQFFKKIYDETASLIAESCLQGQLDPQEMELLLNLLDKSMMEKGYDRLFAVLQKWIKSWDDSELDEIIQATLLVMDWRDPQSIESNLQIIEELLQAKVGDA